MIQSNKMYDDGISLLQQCSAIKGEHRVENVFFEL